MNSSFISSFTRTASRLHRRLRPDSPPSSCSSITYTEQEEGKLLLQSADICENSTIAPPNNTDVDENYEDKGRTTRHLRRSTLCKAGCIAVSTMCCYQAILRVDRINPVGLRVQRTILRHSQNSSTRLDGHDHCESPSLPPGKGMHLVVGGYRNSEPGFEMNNNYLSDTGLTNAEVFWYRRINPDVPEAKDQKLPCGITMHERFLTPNRGRDGAAFYDHIIQVYDDPPAAIAFLHGHGAHAWHTSCDAVFGRTVYYYRDLVSSLQETRGDKKISFSPFETNATEKRVSNHMMTLTSSSKGTKNYVHKWFGQSAWKVQLQVDTPELPISSAPLHVPSHFSPGFYANTNKPCRDLLNRWKDVIPKYSRKDPYMSTSCCASFILPGYRIRRYPRALYEDLFGVLTDEENNDLDIGRFCFEYIVFDLFHDEGSFAFQEVSKFYDEADALIHGKKGQSDRTEPDESVVNRLDNCLAS